MPTTVEIPGVGQVDFPDDMSEQDIVTAIESKIVPSFVETKKQEAQSFQAESKRIMADAPKTWMEQIEARPGQQKRVPIMTIAPGVAMPWPNIEDAPTIPASPLEPLLPLPRYDISKEDSTTKMVAKSVANFAIGLPEFMTSPVGMASVPAAAAAPNVVGALFSADMLRTVASDAPELYENWDSLSKEEKVEGLVNSIGATTLGGLLGVKATKGFVRKESIRRRLKQHAQKYGLPTKAQWRQMSNVQVPLPPAGTSAQSTFTPSLRPQAPGFDQVLTVPEVAKPVVPAQPAPSAKPLGQAPLLDESQRVADEIRRAEPPVEAQPETPAQEQPSTVAAPAERGEPPAPAPTVAGVPPTGPSTPEVTGRQGQSEPQSEGANVIRQRISAQAALGKTSEASPEVGRQVRDTEEPARAQSQGAPEVQPSDAAKAEVTTSAREEVTPSEKAQEGQVQEILSPTPGPAAAMPQAPATKRQAPPPSTTLPAPVGAPQPAPQPTATATAAVPQPFTPAALRTPKSKRVGIVPGQPLPQIDSYFTKIKNWFGKYFTAKGGRPNTLFDLENTMRFERTMYSRQIERLNVDLRRALRRVYGISAVREAAGGFRLLPDADVRLMDEYLKGNVFNAASIPPEIRGVLDNMRAVVDGLSTELANMLRTRAATLPRAQATRLINLSDQILQNRNHYLHRSYAFFDSKLNATDWFQQMPDQVRMVAEQYIQANTGAGAPLSQLQAQSILTRWLSDLKSVTGNAGDGTSKLGSKDLSVLLKRKNIPDPIRALMGEYTDPLINFTKTVSKMAQHVASQKFLNDAREAGLRDGWLYEDRNAPPGFTEQIAGPGSDVMNPMSGMRTSPQIAQVFVEHMKQMRESHPVIQLYYRLNAITKFAATAQSMMTQMRNLMGQPFFWGMSGHWSLDAVRTGVGAMREELFKRGDAGQRAYLDDASRYGLFGDTARSAELEALLKDADFQTVAPEKLTDWSLGRLLKRYGVTGLGKIYRISDEFGKLVGWEVEKRNVSDVNPTWTQDQISAEAARRIRNFYPTYSMVPKAVQGLRKLPVGPFVSFAYEAVRTSGHAIAQSVNELRSANAAERTIGAKRMASQLATLSAPTAVSALTAYMYGVSGEEQDDFRLFQPPWSRNSKFAWMPGKPGERNTINLSYMNPYQYTDVLRAAVSGIRDDKPVVDLVANTLKEALSPYLSEQLMATAMLDVARNSTDTGYKVYNPQDTLFEKITKVANHLVMPLMPGTVQRAVKRTIPSFYESETPYGRKLVPAREIAREVTGISMDGFDYKSGLGRGARQFTENMKDAEMKFRSPLYTGKPMTDGEMLESYIVSDEARKRNWSELRLKYLAALRRGVPLQDAVRSLTENGLGNQDSESIAAGIYIPYEVSEQVYVKALSRKKTIPLEMIERYRGSVIRQQLGQPQP